MYIMRLFSLIQAHEESREKKYEYELSWICEESDHVHKMVPEALVKDAEEKANAEIEEEEMGWFSCVIVEFNN